MKNACEIGLDLLNRFIAPSGLGRLNPAPEDNWPREGLPDTVWNENGILFLAYSLVQMKRAEGSIRTWGLAASVRKTIESLRRFPDRPGLYNRQPGNYNERSEAHDNYVGICALAVMFDEPREVAGMIDVWWSNWGFMNNVRPGRKELWAFRQPGELALYYIAANRKPPLFCMIWMCVGLWLNFSKKRSPGQTQLAWLRIWTIDESGGPEGFLNRVMYRTVRHFWFKGLEKNWGKLSNVFGNYFQQGHPVLEYQKFIEEYPYEKATQNN